MSMKVNIISKFGIAGTAVAVLLLVFGQCVAVQSCFLIGNQEMTNILGAGVPNCDCASTGGTTCTEGFPPNCTTSSDCVGCNDSHYDEACNTPSGWPDWDCIVDSDHTCNPKMIATCGNVSGQWLCINPENVTAVNCNGPVTVKQCHY